MRFNRKTGKTLQWLALTAGAAVVGHLAAPGTLPEIISPAYLPYAVIGLQIAQKLLHDSAWGRNWNGSPAEEPAPPDPKRFRE